MEKMTAKERWLAAIRMQPVDCLPFWAKLGGYYARAQTEPFASMNAIQLHTWMGSDRHEAIADCITEKRSNTSAEVVKDGNNTTTLYKTKYGTARSVIRLEEAAGGPHPVEFPIKTVDDIRIMTEWFSDVQVEPDNERLVQIRLKQEQTGQDASTYAGIGTSPMMRFMEMLAGIENAHYFLVDNTSEVEELFDAIHRINLRRTEIMTAYHPADMLYFTENTSTTIHSPEQYRKYSFRHIQEYGEIMQQAGRIFVLHMCGHLKALLPDLAKIKANVFEAYTTPTVGNTTLLDGRSACPDKCLVGGTNAALWTSEADVIIAELEKDLDSLPHHRGLVITSAGVMPPLARPETIKKVSDWVKSYKIKM